MFKKIKKAILPVAGFGTRFLPVTKAQPKEMLPIVDKPVIQYLVEDAVSSGIEEIIFVTGRGKNAIENHFDVSYELEYTLVEKNKQSLLKEVQKISNLAKFSYVRQPRPIGNGHAILCARHLISPDEPVIILFGDDIIDSQIPATKQLINVYNKLEKPIIALNRVKKEDIPKFGIVDSIHLKNKLHKITDFVEKPNISEAPTNLAVVGKYIITPQVFDYLENIQKKSEEIGLDDAFVKMIKDGCDIYGYEFIGKRYDCGDKFGWIEANIEFGLKHPDIGNKLYKYIKNLQKKIK